MNKELKANIAEAIAATSEETVIRILDELVYKMESCGSKSPKKRQEYMDDLSVGHTDEYDGG